MSGDCCEHHYDYDVWEEKEIEGGRAYRRRHKLSNGSILSVSYDYMLFYPGVRKSKRDIRIYNFYVSIYRKRKNQAFDGTPTGPGGTEAYGLIIEDMKIVLAQLERLAIYSHANFVFEVDAVTPKLFKIYARSLQPLGFRIVDTGGKLSLRKWIKEDKDHGEQ